MRAERLRAEHQQLPLGNTLSAAPLVAGGDKDSNMRFRVCTGYTPCHEIEDRLRRQTGDSSATDVLEGERSQPGSRPSRRESSDLGLKECRPTRVVRHNAYYAAGKAERLARLHHQAPAIQNCVEGRSSIACVGFLSSDASMGGLADQPTCFSLPADSAWPAQ